MAIAFNVLTNKVRASIKHSTIRTSGSVSVHAKERGLVVTISIGGAGSKKSAIAGSAGVSVLSNSIDANVETSTITAGGAVTVKAEDKALVVAVSGGLGVGKSGAGVGVSISYNRISNGVAATIVTSTVTSTTVLSTSAHLGDTLVGIGLAAAGAPSRTQVPGR